MLNSKEAIVLILSISLALAMVPPTIPEILSVTGAGDKSGSVVNLAKFAANLSLNEAPQMSMTCQNALLSALADPFGTTVSYNLIMLSGKKFNDLGDYEACKKAKDSYYVLMGIMTKTLSASYGACVPKVCDIKQFESLKPGIISALKSISSAVPLTDLDVSFYDLAKENKRMSKTGTGYVITILLLILFTAIAIIATIHDLYGQKPTSTPAKILNCFSAARNISSMFDTRNRVDKDLEILNGLRVFSMIWIVLAHGYTFDVVSRLFNIEDMVEAVKTQYVMTFVKLGTLAVDVFFFLSGFLAAMGFAGVFKGGLKWVSIPIAYFKRYMRLFPILVLAILYVLYLLTTEKDEPFVPEVKRDLKICQDYWYLNLLYVSNLSSECRYCPAWTWYIMNDFQFFIISPLIVAAFYYSKKIGLLTVGVLTLASIITQSVIFTTNNLNSSLSKPGQGDYMQLYYAQPYCRVVPYFVGILLYYVYAEKKQDETTADSSVFTSIAQAVMKKTWVKYALYVVGLALLILPFPEKYFMDNHPDDWGQAYATFFEVSFRPLFVLGVACIILPSMLGNGRFLLSIIGHGMFNPLGKMTYAAYIFHPFFYMFLTWYTLNGQYFAHMHTVITFLSVLFATYLVSFAATTIFESPVIQLLKLAFDSPKPVAKSVTEPKESMLLNKDA